MKALRSMPPAQFQYLKPAILLTLLLAVILLQCAQAQTTRVTLGGVIGNKAILTIDGTPPRTLAIGQSYQGVKLLSAQGQTATILITEADDQTKRLTLRVGEAPFTINTTPPAAPPDTTSQHPSNSQKNCTPAEQHIYVAAHGMFKTLGYINGRAVDFLVDTGATLVSMDEKQALALGITNYRQGRPITQHTANGSIQSYLITLDSVKVGAIEINHVHASVGGNQNIILLGNSFLSELDVEMTPNRLILKKTCP